MSDTHCRHFNPHGERNVDGSTTCALINRCLHMVTDDGGRHVGKKSISSRKSIIFTGARSHGHRRRRQIIIPTAEDGGDYVKDASDEPEDTNTR